MPPVPSAWPVIKGIGGVRLQDFGYHIDIVLPSGEVDTPKSGVRQEQSSTPI